MRHLVIYRNGSSSAPTLFLMTGEEINTLPHLWVSPCVDSSL